jgi:hypothetical protein
MKRKIFLSIFFRKHLHCESSAILPDSTPGFEHLRGCFPWIPGNFCSIQFFQEIGYINHCFNQWLNWLKIDQQIDYILLRIDESINSFASDH